MAQLLVVLMLKSARKTTDPLSGYFGIRNGLSLPINEKWRGYKLLLFILSANPGARVNDVPFKFVERERGKSKIVKGFAYIGTCLTELILAKRAEIEYR